MTLKTLLAALALTAAPAMTLAMGCSSQHQQAMSCADGLIYDSETQSCVQQLSG